MVQLQEYYLGCENIIKDHGRIEDGKLIINKAGYELVILPPGLKNIDDTSFELLKLFVQAGGKVLQIGSNPQFVDGGNQSFGELQNYENWEIITELNESLFVELSNNENIRFENLDSIRGRVFHQRREFEDGQLLFVTNFDKEEFAEIKINMHGKSVIDLNAADGKIEPYIFEKQKGRVHFSISLPPSGSQLLFISTKNGDSKKPKIIPSLELLATGKTTISNVTSNILNLDYVELTMGKFQSESMYFYKAANEIWKEHGYPDNPWVSSSQFKTELVDADTFPEGSGFSVSYLFDVEEDFQTKNVRLVVERPWLYQVMVNGIEVTPIENENWFDSDFLLFEIGDLIQPGKNEAVLTASPFSIYCELEPVYLLGDFAALSLEKGWEIQTKKELRIGSWKEQGMPFYGQTVSYTKSVDIKVEGDFLIRLPEWKGTVAEVVVGGEHRGVIQSKPYELRIRMVVGRHDVKVNVTGSNKNTFGPHHNFTTPGIVTPGSFKNAPVLQPPGEKYDLLDYGLMKDFEVYELK